MGDDPYHNPFAHGDMMSFFGAGTMSLDNEQYAQDLDEDDIFASYPPASFLAADELALGPGNESAVVPDIQVQPPSRVNTHMDQYEQDLSGAAENRQPWNPLGVANGDEDRNAAQMDVLISGSLTSTLPSDAGTSLTSVIDSAFASQEACEVCNHVYRNNSNKRKHILTHIKPNKCHYPECKRSKTGFATPNDRERHLMSVHKDGLKKWWKCGYPGCSKTTKLHCFDRKDNFIAHIKRRHLELRTSQIDELVKRSEHEPTQAELKAVLDAKDNKAPARGIPIRRSSRGRRRVKSDASSVSRAMSPMSPGEGSSKTFASFPQSAPAIPFERSSPSPAPFSPMEDLNFAGIGHGMLPESVAPSPVKLEDTWLSAGQHSMPSRNTNFSFEASEMEDGNQTAWKGKQRATTTQPMFQSLPQQQFMGSRGFSSMLSDQMNQQTRYNAVSRDNGLMQGVQGTHPICPITGMSPDVRNINAFGGRAVFPHPKNFGLSMSQSFDTEVNSPAYHSSATTGTSFSQAHGQMFNLSSPSAPQDIDMDIPPFYMPFQGFGPLDEG